MKKLPGLFAFTTVLFVLIATKASADRLIIIPEGITLSTGSMKAEYVQRTNGDAKTFWVNVGVARVELEGAWFEDFSGSSLNAFSAQVAVLPETSFTPAVALGVRDMGNNTDKSEGFYDGNAIYVAASKGVPVPSIPILSDLKVHVGAGTGSLAGVFFGAETKIGEKLHIAAEYDADDFNFAIKYPVIPMLNVEALSVHDDSYIGATFALSF